MGDDPDFILLSDKGKPLKQSTDDFQLCYKAIPHYHAFTQRRAEKLKQLRQRGENRLKEGDNQPIPISNEHELAHLYLNSVYGKLLSCNILSLDMDALLQIMSKASCFQKDLRKKASSVQKEVRDKWLCTSAEFWTENETEKAFAKIEALAGLVPALSASLKSSADTCAAKEFHRKVQKYRNCVKNGQHEKVQFRINKLLSERQHEIYVERSYKETVTHNTTSFAMDLLQRGKTVLLKGEAGSGKSSMTTKLIQRWAEGDEGNNLACILFLSAGSEGKVSLQRILWEGHSDVVSWKEEEFRETYLCLKALAIEGKLAILIDGLDEFGSFTVKDVTNASQAADHPHLDVDMRTACAGILTQKIFPGARVLATGRTTLINNLLLDGKGILFDLEPLTEADRDTLVTKLEDDVSERERIRHELKRISTKSSEVFFKTPLSMRNVVELIQSKKVDVSYLRNATEIYLMFSMKNLDFHTDQNTSFTELDPPEYHDFLKWSMMICQNQIQNSKNDTNINSIEGNLRNVKDSGLCFEKKVLRQILQIPLEFIKKLGFFDVRFKDSTTVSLDVVHLSYMEFGCAGSLCREGVDLEKELSKIEDEDRFEAVTTFLAGLFSQNPSIPFLTTVRHIAENFLLLLGNDNRPACIQAIFRSILKRSCLGNPKDVSVKLSIPCEGELRLQSPSYTQLLVEIMKISSDKICPQPTINEIHVTERGYKDMASTTVEVNALTQLLKLQDCDVAYLYIEKISTGSPSGYIFHPASAQTESEMQSLISLLSIPNLKDWTIGGLRFGEEMEIEELKVIKGKFTQLIIHSWTGLAWTGLFTCKSSLSFLCNCLADLGIERLKLKKLVCRSEFSLDSIASLLAIPTLVLWEIDHLEIDGIYIKNPWQRLAVGRGTIRRIDVSSCHSLKDWVMKDLEAVSVHHIGCFDCTLRCYNEEEVDILCTALAIPRWDVKLKRVDLCLTMRTESWGALNDAVGGKKIGTIFVNELDLQTWHAQLSLADQWKIKKLLLPDHMGTEDWAHFEEVVDTGCVNMVFAKEFEATNENVTTWHKALSITKQWRVEKLILPKNMAGEAWAALENVVTKGKVDLVSVEDMAFNTASDHQICSLWQVTNSEVRQKYVEDCCVTIAFKNEGEDGLLKLPTIGLIGHMDVEVKMQQVECMSANPVKTLCADLAVAKTWEIEHLLLPDNMEAAGWEELLKLVDKKGNIKEISTGHLLMEASDEEVVTICRVLGFTQGWEVKKLQLPENLGATAWEALGKAAIKGKVDNVIISELSLRAAHTKDIGSLWAATALCWRDYLGVRTFAMKSEGEAGLQMLSAIHTGPAEVERCQQEAKAREKASRENLLAELRRNTRFRQLRINSR